MWSPEEQEVIESPYWKILVEQANSIVSVFKNNTQIKKDNIIVGYRISGNTYKFLQLTVNGIGILTLGNETKNNYGNVNKVNLYYFGYDPEVILDMLIIKYQELKNGI